LNRGQKGKSELDVMLGVIPSYTALGMAALLPHKTLEITSKGDFEIKGISTEGTANREKILQTVKKEAFAIRAEEILSLNQQQLHEKLSTSGNKLIYIYHNTIDARGDNASTENEVFEATEKAFGEICTLVRKLRTLDLSIQNIVITADHGYIYRRTPLEERNKTPKEDLAGVKSKRRFIMARENLEQPGCMGEQSGVSWTTSQGTQSFPMSYLDKNSVLYAILPRSTNCFKVSGSGSRYVHGGTSLQEVVIPVIRFRSDKKANPSMNVKKVSVSVTSLSHKVTSIITHLTFFQNEIVSDKHLPIRITAYFEDESGNRISNENIIIADSTSKEPQDRAYKEKFTLKNMAYDKAKNYFLVLKDEEEAVNQELERIPFVIDLVFGGNIRF
ncbi:MAG: BREX-1 system phosphatase PglZ type A, partial [Defluviitaleaceae bacterium]|nr:BREX-1 system phosphatase PglZ type A [Defluviitaleaceae bacterium]